MAARCDVCDGRVMPYRTYAFWMKPTARCEECGAMVRLRGFWASVGTGAALTAVALAVIAGFSTPVSVFGTVFAFTALLAAIDYASYHVLRWEADYELAPLNDPLLPPSD